MKLSPVQLVESFPVKLLTEQNLKYSAKNENDESAQEIKFEHLTQIGRSPTESENERRYFSVVGIRSFSEKEDDFPYSYEIVVGGIFSLNISALPEGSPFDDMAARHSFTMLYGQARDWLSNMTSRMRHGTLTLPTMSFMDAVYPKEKQD